MTIGGTPDDLAMTANSLFAQRDEDWEWVIFSPTDLAIEGDDAIRSRIRVVSVPEVQMASRQSLMGAISGNGADAIFLVRAGDVLPVGAFQRVRTALDETGAEFVYGNIALGPDVDITSFDSRKGWTVIEETIDGRELGLVESFEPEPAILLEESFVPTSGLVATRGSFVEMVETFSDLERLTPQLVLARAMTNERKISRVSDVFVVLERQPAPPIDVLESLRITNLHLIPAVESWATRRGLELLDLGAAHNPHPGYRSVDLEGASINCDVRDGLPLADSSVGVIRAVDFMEHINPCRDSTCDHGESPGSKRCVVGMMNEFHRVLAPGGWLFVRSPSSDGRGAFQDPTHVSFWNPNSFWYYTRKEQQRFVRGVTCRFQAARLWQDFPSEWHRQHNIPYVSADLVALKGQRQPGLCEI